MKSKLTISIVVPAYNGRQLLEQNLPTWLAAKEIKKNNISEIVIVDDKSRDDSVVYLNKNFKDKIRLVKHTQNRGFSAAVNTGFRSARHPLICLLNQDVSVEKDFLSFVVGHFNDEKVFGVSLHEKGYGYGIGRFKDGYIVHDPGVEKKQTTHTFWISGGSGVFRRSVWKELIGFDETLLSPFYWEDVDISYRALKRGYKLLWEPKAKVIHAHESTINRKNFRTFKMNLIKDRNHLILNWKNLTSKSLIKKHRKGLFRRVTRHPGYLRVVIAALTKYKQIRKAHKKEMKESTVSDEAIFASFD